MSNVVRRGMHAPIVAAASVFLTLACASSPEDRATVAAAESARMQRTDVPLSHYGDFDLEPMRLSDEVRKSGSKTAVAAQLETKLRARLEPLLADWSSRAGPDSRDRELKLRPVLQRLRVVSGGARFWIGGLAGDSLVDMDIALVDAGTGQKIGVARVSRTAGAMAGGWSVGATDRNLLDYIVDIAHRYLQDSYAPD